MQPRAWLRFKACSIVIRNLRRISTASHDDQTSHINFSLEMLKHPICNSTVRKDFENLSFHIVTDDRIAYQSRLSREEFSHFGDQWLWDQETLSKALISSIKYTAQYETLSSACHATHTSYQHARPNICSNALSEAQGSSYSKVTLTSKLPMSKGAIMTIHLHPWRKAGVCWIKSCKARCNFLMSCNY